MERERPPHARLIRDARLARHWSMDELARRLRQPVTRAHLSDIERGARLPGAALTDDLALALHLPIDYFCFLLGRWPPDLRDLTASPERVCAAFAAFRAALKPDAGPRGREEGADARD